MSTRLSMNTAFRPRPIDINRPLEIHRGILPSEADGCVRGVPSMPTGMEPEEEEEAHIQEAIAASLAFSSQISEVEIPTPICRVVDGYDTAPNPHPYAPGTTYIFFKGDDVENTVEYDEDSEDEEFLNILNAAKKLLTEDKFEYAMDRFEKEIHFHRAQEIPLPRAEALLKGAPGGAVRREVLAPLIEHWKNKRTAKDNNSLLTRFMKPPAFDDPSPYVAFRPREKDKEKNKKVRKNDSTALAKMRALRQEMERSRTLLEMLKKREKLKKDQMTIVSQVFEQLLIELAVKSEDDGRPLTKKIKKSHTTTPPGITSPIPSISSPTESLQKPRPPQPKVRPEYFYDIATVNTRLKIDPATAAPPYVLQQKQSSRSSSSSSSSSSSASSAPTSVYKSLIAALTTKPTLASRAQRNAWLLEDEEELSDFEDNDALLYDEDERVESDEDQFDFQAEIAKLDEKAFFPRRVDDHIVTSRTATPFRGRARLGRGGRILFDRPIRFPAPPSIPPPPPPPPSTLPTTQPSVLSPLPSGESGSTNINDENNNNNNSNITENDTSSDTTYKLNATDQNIEDDGDGGESEREKDNDAEMAENESDDEVNSENSKPSSQRSSSPVNSEPEARLHFTHRSPQQSSLPPRTSPKLFSPPLSPSSSSQVLPSSQSPVLSSTTSPIPSASPSSAPSSPSATCIEKMPTVLHTYSKKQQKRKLVDSSVSPISY